MKKIKYFIIVLISLTILNGCSFGYIASPISNPNFTKKNQTVVKAGYGFSFGKADVKSLDISHSFSDNYGVTTSFFQAKPTDNRKHPEYRNSRINYGELGLVYYNKFTDSKVGYYSGSLGFGYADAKSNTFNTLKNKLLIKYKYFRIFAQANIYMSTNVFELGLGMRLSHLQFNYPTEHKDLLTEKIKIRRFPAAISSSFKVKFWKQIILEYKVTLEVTGKEVLDPELNMALNLGYTF